MNPRERMRASNQRAIKWLLDNGYDEIWLKQHGQRQDKVYRSNGVHYFALDLWNQYDGACWKEGELYFLAIKTNAWQSERNMRSWLQDKFGIHAIAINVKKVGKRFKVLPRIY